MSNKAFSLVSGSCKLATKCSIFNAWLFDEALLFEVVLVCCCCVCAACAAIIIARTNRPIDWKRFDSLSALKAFRTRLEQISIVCERNFPRNTKGGLTTRLLLKNIRVFVVVVLFRRCCVVVAESCSSCFRCRDHLWGNVESEISSKEKSVVFSVALFLSLSHKRWRRLTRRTKKRERERVLQRALSHLRLSRVFAGASFCFREE